MSFTIPTFEQIRAALLRDVKNLLPDAATTTDSDAYVRASSVASAVEGLYQHQAWMARQILPDTADTAYLELHASLRGITRKAATTATGMLTVTGTAGAEVPASTLVRHVATGATFRTTAAVTLGEGGTATIACAAASAGAMPDYADEPVLFVTAPTGVQTEARLTLTGGTDAETDAELLARLLDYMRNPPGGGNRYDYRRWAMEVPGITGAWVYPLRRGIGTVDVAVLSAGGLPSAELVAAAQASIDAKRPVACKDALVLPPAPLPVDVQVRVRLSGVLLATLAAQVQAALAAYFLTLEPGGLVVRSRIAAIISGLPGVADCEVSAPSANVQAVVDAARIEWPRLGAVTVEAM